MSLWAPIIGTLGILLIEASYVPQIARLYRRKDADDVALLFPLCNVGGRVLALGYAVSIGEPLFSVGLLVGVGMRFTFLVQVVHYRWLRTEWLGAPRAAPEETP